MADFVFRRVVAIDMAAGYARWVKDNLEEAQIVFDHQDGLFQVEDIRFAKHQNHEKPMEITENVGEAKKEVGRTIEKGLRIEKKPLQ